MAGIYLHIPFCRKACHYCDFHFSVSMKNKAEVLEAMQKEIKLQTSFFAKGTKIQTIYFGGGTPSILSKAEISGILDTLYNYYAIDDEVEICLEANPDDLTREKLKELHDVGVNRLSIGVQSLDQNILEWMNRSHTVEQALKCISDASDLGFSQLNIDLIYGVPGLSSSAWQDEVETVLNWPINHLSAYSLTLEEKTAYAHLVNKKQYKAPDDERAAEHYTILNTLIEDSTWQQYEVSNYCRDEEYSKHNTAYWQGKSYLGIGPSAHSFNGLSRFWNINSNAAYLQSLQNLQLNQQSENLSQSDKINDYILVSLRTKWGLSLSKLVKEFGYDLLETKRDIVNQYVENEMLVFDDDYIRLNSKGLLFADALSSELFIDYSSQTSS
jgi:oxygen-independent coproporphyrinogen-3 oxidase